MIIQWYPGHMDKALREMQNTLKLVDAIIYVLDSRAPYSCINPKYKDLIGNKPALLVLNKADLVNEEDLNKWTDLFKRNGYDSIKLNSTISNASKIILSKMEVILSDKIEKNKAKGIQLPLRFMVIGVPNCGKSTLINNICPRKKTETGNKAGVTRANQWVKINANYEILDTPGTLWPSFKNNQVAKNLAYIGSIKDEVLDIEELAYSFIEDVKDRFFNNIKERYSLLCNENTETIDIYNEICLKRGFILRGNELDYNRGAKAIIDDFRKGRMGKIILDKIEDAKNGFKLI